MAALFEFEPVGMDAYSPHAGTPKRGTLVRKMHPGRGAPRNGTMGHCYVEDADTGEFYGLVLVNSLKPVKGVTRRVKA